MPNPDQVSGVHTQPLLQSGDRVGNYVVEGVHATGGNSTVYKAHHATLHRAAALKVLHQDLLGQEFLTRFRQEAEAISSLRHPHIVEVYDIGEFKDGRPYLLMEWLEGKPLSEELRKRGTFTPTEVLAVMSEIGSALTAVHQAGFVHRDIKPNNIIALPRGDSFTVKLVDFGLVKALTPAAGNTPLTQKGVIIGTPDYMAPEQVLVGTIDARTDIYALGIVMYELLTGRVPFQALDLVELIEMHVRAPPPKVSDAAPVPLALDDVIRRALAKKAADRHASVVELLEDFRRAISRTAPATGATAGLGMYVEVRVELTDEPDEDELLMQLDVALEQARLTCEALKLDLAVETNESVLGVALHPADEARALELVRAMTASALGLELLCAARSNSRLIVHLKVVVHAGSLIATTDGGRARYTDGEVLRLGERAAAASDGVFLTEAALSATQGFFKTQSAADLHRVTQLRS